MNLHSLDDLHAQLIEWYDYHGRDLPMRSPSVSAWGTLVFEVMSQQTPIPRVQPVWLKWMDMWPTPNALSTASAADVLVAWDRLGYPSRALRLRECAQVLVHDWHGSVPSSEEALLSLPGIGPYTASAVLAFHYRQRIPVLDTNIRRVLARFVCGVEHQGTGSASRAEIERAWSLLPKNEEESAVWNVAVMELGALVCSARTPQCHECPLAQDCVWRERGYPTLPGKKKTQAWAGTDRQARGRVMALLRSRHQDEQRVATYEEILTAATLEGSNSAQAPRVVEGLLSDGLIIRDSSGSFRLP